ncbi:hypothetical protein [Egibacter rhizosphaerae]|uniref:hypothetical protein n=1 Tax=Egibacter rhizosphaerae TaxID=1670831 RepID=UPI001F0E585A|nr:hypothetical protein [Egibacter rhizosphaerae]
MFRGTWLVYQRALRLQLREPVWVVFGVAQPALYLTLFGPLLEPMAGAPGFGDGDPWLVFTPGMVLLLALLAPPSPASASSPRSGKGSSSASG